MCRLSFGDKTITHFPSSISELEKCEPVYEEYPGWKTDTSGITKWEDMPQEAKTFITRLSELMGCPVNLVSVGPEREQTITVSTIF